MYYYDNNAMPYRYCTSVGVYQGYDSKKHLHMVAIKNGNELLHESEKRYSVEYLDEFQFMIWYACHGEIIKESEMYEMASKFWEEAEFPKRPLLKCYNELREKKLVDTVEMYDAATLCTLIEKIQPFVIDLKSVFCCKKSIGLFIKVCMMAIASVFLPSQEKHILKYFKKNPSSNFVNYMRVNNIISEKYDCFIRDVNSLFYKGYLIPIGWTTTLPSSI